MNDTYFLELMIKEKQAEFEGRAVRARLRRSASFSRPGVRARLGMALGSVLIRWGETMVSRSRLHPCPDAKS